MASTPKKKSKKKLHFHFKSSAGKSTSYEKPHEKWQGNIIDRTRLVGRSAIDFIGLLAKQKQDQSAGIPNPEAEALAAQARKEKVAAARAGGGEGFPLLALDRPPLAGFFMSRRDR